MKIFGSIQELVSLVYRKGSSQITLRPNSGTTYAADRAVDLPPGDSAHVLVSETATQSLTNKTINVTVGNNSISNLPITSLLTVLADANKVLLRDSSGAVISGAISNANIDAAANIALTKLATVTASRALASDGSGNISASSITATELGHLSGVTSNIQTQLDNKVDENPAIVGATATKITFDSKGLVTAGTALAAGDLPSGIDATKIGAGSVDNTEFGYLNGLASSAVGVSDSQTLLNKQISSTAAITGALTLPSGTDGQRPTAVNGMVRYNTTSSSFEGYANGAWSGIGGGGTTDRVTQASAGFVVGDLLYVIGANTYAKAIASAANTAEVVGMVSRIIDPTPATFTFEITLSGEVSGLGSPTPLVPGEVYFLDPTTAGGFTTTEPSTIGQVSVPVGVASSTTTMYVAPKRGVVVGGVNARAEVALTSGATTNVQNVAGMSAGELSGWVFISSAAPKRFYVSAQFALSGAGGDYNLSYQTSGDTPPAGFLMDITTTGIIRVTLPASSGSTSVINYALNAPAIGASFPLSVSASALPEATYTVVGASKRNRIQKKSLNTGVQVTSGATANVTELTFNNLVVGRNYKLFMHAEFTVYDNAAGALLRAFNNAVEIARIRQELYPIAVGNKTLAMGTTQLFTAAGTTVTFTYSNTSGGNGTLLSGSGFSYAILEEINDTNLVTDFT